MKKYLKPLVVLTLITLIFGTIYGSVQQVLRMDANDPQIELAQDAAAKLDHDATPASLVSGKVDVNASLSPFLMIYDKQGNAVASPAYVGQVPLKNVPLGVLASSNSKSYNAVTWEPDANTRLAAVSVKAHDYYVLSARSLSEIDSRIATIGKIVLLGWLASVLVLAAAYRLPKYLK